MKTKFISIIILFVGIVLVNLIATKAKGIRLDTTNDKTYSLTKGTKEFLAKIEGNIDIEVHFSRSREDVPVYIKNQADRVLSLLEQFEDNYGSKDSKITLTVIDPKPDTDEEEIAEKSDFGIKGRLGNTLFYTGIKIIYQGEEENINFLHESETFLERQIITTLYGLTNDNKPVIGIINSMEQMAQHQPFFQDLGKLYEVENIGATATSLPEGKDLAALVIIHPKNLPDELQFAIDQYLLGGGKLFVAVDPSSWIDQYANGNLPQNLPIGGFQMPNRIDANSDLDKLFKAWGVNYDKTQVLADLGAQVPMPKLGDYPAWIRVIGDEQIKKNEFIPSDDLLLFMECGAFSLSEDSGLSLTKLVEASPGAGLLSTGDLPRTQSLYPQYPFDPFQVNPRTLMSLRSQSASINASIEKSKDGKRHTIGGILKGNFKTAFPDGKPGDTTPDGKDAKPAIKEGESEVVLFADFDFLNNLFQRFQNTDNMRPISAHNGVLALNLVDYLVTGEKSLGAVSVKGDSYRPFVRIEKLEAERQQKLNEKNKNIDKEILAANTALEAELGKINMSMQQQQRGAQIQMREKSLQIQKELEPYRKYVKPDGSISLDRQKDAATIKKLMDLQKQMDVIRGQVQEEMRKSILELQAQIQVKQEEANEKIKELEKLKRKDRKEGREEIESVEFWVKLANTVVVPPAVLALGIFSFVMRRNRR